MRKTLFGFVALAVALGVTATSALAQVENPSQVNVQATGLVTLKTNDQVPSNDVTKTGGLLLGYSYQFNRWAGVEGNYGYTRNTHHYDGAAEPSSLQADFHEVTGSFVAHIPVRVRRIRPYALVGAGALVFDPTDSVVVNGADRQTKAAFVYGGGANIDLTNRFGIRAEYRGLAYKIPDFAVDRFAIDKLTHLAQPSVGFFVRF